MFERQTRLDPDGANVCPGNVADDCTTLQNDNQPLVVCKRAKADEGLPSLGASGEFHRAPNSQSTLQLFRAE
jgi:hypothetical protein